MIKSPFALLAALALAAAACGTPGPLGGRPTEVSPSAEATAPSGVQPSQRCANHEAGYEISYPDGWGTNPGDVMGPCRVFDPDPIALEEGTEIPFDVAVTVDLEDVPYAEIRDAIGDEHAVHVRSSTETRVAGRAAIRVHGVGTGAALLPEGMARYGYVVDLDERALLVTTFDAGDPPFETKREVVDAMADTLELDPQSPGDAEALRPRASVAPPTTNAETRKTT